MYSNINMSLFWRRKLAIHIKAKHKKQSVRVYPMTSDLFAISSLLVQKKMSTSSNVIIWTTIHIGIACKFHLDASNRLHFQFFSILVKYFKPETVVEGTCMKMPLLWYSCNLVLGRPNSNSQVLVKSLYKKWRLNAKSCSKETTPPPKNNNNK